MTTNQDGLLLSATDLRELWTALNIMENEGQDTAASRALNVRIMEWLNEHEDRGGPLR